MHGVVTVLDIIFERAIFPFGVIAATHILGHHRITTVVIGSHTAIDTVLVIGRAGKHDRPGAFAFRHIDIGGQLHAIAHGHHDHGFVVRCQGLGEGCSHAA